MDVHKPKPVHSWREFLSEIGIIVVGVTIALAGEQIVDGMQWRHKVADAEVAMKGELGIDMAFALGQIAMKDCAVKYLDHMEAAVRDRNPEALRRLYAMHSPFSDVLATHPWRIDTWSSSINSQIPDHIPRDKLATYAFGFRVITTQRERQFVMVDDYAEVMGGRLIDKPTPEVSFAQLAALDKLRATHNLTIRISQVFNDSVARALGVTPDAAIMAAQAEDPARCEKELKAISS